MEKYFETSRIVARPANTSDIPIIMKWEQDPENSNFVWQGTLEEHTNEIVDDNAYLMVFWTKGGERIGYTLCEKHPFDVFELRRIVIEEKGKGYGKEAIVGIFKFAFEELNIHRLWLDVYPDNTTGIKLYESLGMYREGMLRDSYKTEEGIYRNQIIYSLLKEEWEKKFTQS